MSRYRNSSSYSEESSDNEDEQIRPVSNNSLEEHLKPPELEKEAFEPVGKVEKPPEPSLPTEEQVGTAPSFQLTWVDTSGRMSDLPPASDSPSIGEEDVPAAKKSKENEEDQQLPQNTPRKRGRPPKNAPKVKSEVAPGVKRGPGRPRKNPLPPGGGPTPGKKRGRPPTKKVGSSPLLKVSIGEVKSGSEPVVKKRGRPPKVKVAPPLPIEDKPMVMEAAEVPTNPRTTSFVGESTDNDSPRKRSVSDRENSSLNVIGEVVVKRKRGRPPKNTPGKPKPKPPQHSLPSPDPSKPSPISPVQGQDIKALFSSFSELGAPVGKKRGRPPKEHKPIDAEVARLAHLCSNLRFLDKSFCGPSRDWSPQDRVQLFKVVNDLPSTTPDFWEEVSGKFESPQYSAQECQLEYQNCLLSYIYLTLNKRM